MFFKECRVSAFCLRERNVTVTIGGSVGVEAPEHAGSSTERQRAKYMFPAMAWKRRRMRREATPYRVVEAPSMNGNSH